MGCLNPSSWRLTACTIRIPILLGLLAWVWYPDVYAAKNKPVVYHSHVKSGTAAEYSASGELFAVANDKRIWIFESHTLKQLSEMRIVEYVNYDWKFEYRYGLGNSLAFLSDERIATAGLGGMVTIWDTAMGNLVETIDWDSEDGFPIALAFSPQSGALAIGTAKGVVFLVWPGHTRARERLSAYGGAIMALQFSGDGRYVAAAGTGKEMVIWDTQAMAEFARIPTKGVILDVERFGKSGQFLALTGASINAADAIYIGIADRFVPNDEKQGVLDALTTTSWCGDSEANHALVRRVLREAAVPHTAALPAGQVEPHMASIAQLCDGDSIHDIIDNITGLDTDDPWLAKARDSLAHGSKLAACWIHRQLRETRQSSLKEVFQAEIQLATNIIRHPEFAEGVRALLIDKDRKPAWLYPDSRSVPQAVLDGFFTAPWSENPLTDLR